MRTSLQTIVLSGALVGAGEIVPAFAQNPALQEFQFGIERLNDAKEEFEARQRQERLDTYQKPQDNLFKAPLQKDASSDSGPLLKINQIRFSASEILADETLTTLAEPFVGGEFRLGQLLELVNQINETYIDLGFVTARAVLPPQQVKDGVLFIQLVEARTGTLSVSESRAVSRDYVINRMPVRPGEVIDPQAIENALIRFNKLNEAQLRLDLRAGTDFGTSDLNLTVIDPQPYRVTLYTDTKGAPTTGKWRAGGFVHLSAPFGVSDTLDFSGTISKGSQSLLASYSVPVSDMDIRAGLDLNVSKSHVTGGGFEALNIRGYVRKAAGKFTVPLLVDRNWLITTTPLYELGSSRSNIAGLKLENLTHKTSLSANIQYAGEKGFVFLSPSVNRVKLKTKDDTGSASRFSTTTKLSYQGYYAPTSNWWLTVSGAGQWSPHDNIAPSEKLSIGGSANNRAYDDGLLSGDEGYHISAESNYLLPKSELIPIPDTMGIVGYAFADHGGVFTKRPNDDQYRREDFATSVGFGARLTGIGGFATLDAYGALGLDRVHSAKRQFNKRKLVLTFTASL